MKPVLPTHYRNPVIPADFSDPDAIRVGDTYWLTASTFNRTPGLPILRSHDLVHWEHVANALTAVSPIDHYRLPRRGGGVWAPSLRYHDGEFIIVFPDPDQGLWVTRATDPTGEWSEPQLLLAGQGRIDPCPLWDDDGRAYLVYGWAGSRSGIRNRLSMVEVSPDLGHVIGPERVVIDADKIPGYGTLEGPKFHKHGGYYWISAPAGGVETGWQSVFRARSPFGPYGEHRILLAQGDTDINGPHQGSWVDTPDGEWWFLHFQAREAYGRIVLLEPMGWGEDGWPWMGVPGPNQTGQPVRTHVAPERTRDSFELDSKYRPVLQPLVTGADGSLLPQWQWQANPDVGWYAPAPQGGVALVPQSVDRGDLRSVPQVLTQRLADVPFRLEAQLDLDPAAPATERDGVRAGVVVLGDSYTFLGLESDDSGWRVAAKRFTDPAIGEANLLGSDVTFSRTGVLRVRVDVEGGWATWSFQVPDHEWQGGWRFLIDPGRWVGAGIGFVATRSVGSAEHGTQARVTNVRFELLDE